MEVSCPTLACGPDTGKGDTMNRRAFTRSVAASAALAVLDARVATGEAAGGAPSGSPSPDATRLPPLAIGMLVYPDMVLLDLVGPQTVFSLLMAKVHLVGKDSRPATTDVGVAVQPTTTFADCPEQLDVLFVPGGLKGTVAAMDDPETLDFLARRGTSARFVTSVCTGSLLLGAAGLLRGYRAASHWYVRDLLPLLGATPAAERVVMDRNRLTGGGVTAGIDFGLTLAATLRGQEYARRVQLVIEYDPQPPHRAGTPETAGAAAADDVRRRRAPAIAAARQAALRAKARLGT
jgi:cyclohexyl-isocyanide hydratase